MVQQTPATPPQITSAHAAVPRRERHRRAGITLATRLLLAEAAVFVGVASVGRAPWVAIIAAAVIVPMLVLVFGRSRGSWWIDTLVLRRRLRRRAGRPAAADPRLAALGSLASDVSIRTVVDRGRSIGIAQDDAGWFAGVALLPPAGVRGDATAPLRLGPLLAAVSDAEGSVSSAQLVVHTVPARSVMDDQPAAYSYASLGAGLPGLPPVERTSWITVRVDPPAAADLVARHADVDALHRTLAAAAHRIGRAAGRAGLSYQVLDEAGLVTALLRSCGADTAPEDGTAATSGEGWGSWLTAGLAHACFWVRELPPTDRLGPLIDALTHTPATLTSVSLSVQPVPADRSELSLRLLVRVAAEPATLPRTCQALTTVAARLGATLTRLDGEHEPATYATAPTGGLTR